VLVEWDPPPLLVERPEGVGPLGRGHRTRLLEAHPGQLPDGLVVVDERALEADQAAGRRQSVEQASGKDELNRLLLGGDRIPPFKDGAVLTSI
jgi:hypothetical protein